MPASQDVDHTAPDAARPDAARPDAARQQLEAALAPYLADGWQIVWQAAFMAHLARDGKGIDVIIEPEGTVTVQPVEMPSLAPLRGRLLAWGVLLLSFLAALLAAWALGFFG